MYRKLSDLPEVIPLFPLDGALLLPGGVLPLRIFEPRYLNMVDDAMAGGRMIGMIQTGPGPERERPHLARVGCAGRITSYSETGDGRYLIALTGVCRFALGEELDLPSPYRQLRADWRDYEADLADDEEIEFDRAPLMTLLRRFLDAKGLGIEWETVTTAPAPALVNSLSMALPFAPAEKQALLEARTLGERREALEVLLRIDAALGGGEDEDEAPSLQ
jgi:hypothetical protein